MKKILALAFLLTNPIWSFGQFGLLKDINQTEAGSNPQNFTEANGFVFFTVQTNDGYELWQTDGTEGGTKKATGELLQGIGDYLENELYVYNDELYFVATINQDENFRLMKTDGFAVETVLENMPSARLYFFNGHPHYLAGPKLFKIENSTSILVKQFTTTSNTQQVQAPQVINDKLIFFAKFRDFTNNSGYSLEIWVSDGTETGTTRLKKVDDMISGLSSGGIFVYDKASVVAGNKCFFVVQKDTNYSEELWQTDGTVSGTFMVKNINNFSLSNGAAFVSQFRPYKGGVVFIHRDSELWFSDGTDVGTTRLLDAFFLTAYRMAFWGELDGNLFFATSDNLGSKLWTTDGSVGGTKVVKNFDLTFNASPNQFYSYNDTLYFVANYSELWRSDGTEAGTSFAANIPKPDYYPAIERIILQNEVV